VARPILRVLSIRFLGERPLNSALGKEFKNLIWELPRIARARGPKITLSSPPVQPGTEEPRDIAYLQQLAMKPPAATPGIATPSAASAATPQPDKPQPPTPPPAPQQAPAPLPPLQEPSTDVAQRAGVHSM